MHPDIVPGEYPSKDEYVEGAEEQAFGIKPGKTGESFKERVVQFLAANAAQRQKPANETNNVGHFRAQYAFPTVRFQ